MLTAKRNEMCFCPGCSHGVVLEQLGRALDQLKHSPQQVCLVSDIGCIGTADRYFSCNTFHGLHGRSVTYAEGIKQTQGDMLVIVLIGDGGCGIGTAHLVHAARRNADIKVIVCNNFNFGMTGGQHSPTTPSQCPTITCSDGVREHPLDICQTVVANGASYVARYSALDKDCAAHMVRALSTPGFVLVDLWELCAAYFVQRNRLTPRGLSDLAEKLNMPFGVLHEASGLPGRDASMRPVAVSGNKRITTTCRLQWSRRTEIRVAGSAGQHVRSAVTTMGQIAVAGGLFAASQDDFPITVRKGFSVSDLILDHEPILYTGVDRPDLIVILSQDGLIRLGDLSCLMPDTLIVAAEPLAVGSTRAEVRHINLRAVEQRAGKGMGALAVLAAGMVTQRWITQELLIRLAMDCLSGQHSKAQLTAIKVASPLPTNKGEKSCTVH